MSIIFGCLFLGKTAAHYIPLALPGNIIGMVLLFVFLAGGIVKLEDISDAGNLFLDNLVLLFVPVGVGIIRFKDIIASELLSIIVVGVGGFLILFVTVGKMAEFIQKWRG